MKTNRTTLTAMLVAGLVGVVTAAQADVWLGTGSTNRIGYTSASLSAPWYGYVLDRGRGWIETELYGRRVHLDIVKGHPPLVPGHRFRVIPIRRDGGMEVGELRHEGDVLGIVRYAPVRGYYGGTTRGYDHSPFRPGGYGHRPSYRGNRGSGFRFDVRIGGDRDGKRHRPPATYDRRGPGRDGQGPRGDRRGPDRDGRGPGRDGGGRRGGNR